MSSETSSEIIVSSNDANRTTTQEEEKYVLYKYRFVVLVIFIIISNQNGLMWTVFLPLQTTVRDIFQEGITWVSFSTLLISNITYVPANFIGNYVVDTYGLRVGLLTGGLLTVIGAWVRVLSKYNFIWILVGQCFSGFAVPYFYSTPQKVSNIWFGPKERTVITTIIVCSFTFATSFGSVMPFFFIDLKADNETMLRQFNQLMITTALIASVCLLFVIFFMRAKPQTPPSKAAAAKKHNSLNSLKKIVKNKNCMVMILSTSITYSTVSTYFGTIQQMVSPYKIKGDEVGAIISVSSLIGVAGAAIGAGIVQKSKKYNFLLIGASVLSFFALIGNLLIAETSNAILFGIAVIVFRVLMEPVLPIALEYGFELSFPIAESTAAGLWFVSNQLFATIESFGVDAILEHSNSPSAARMTFLLIIALMLLSIIPLFFVKEDLRREKYEKKGLLDNEKQELVSSDD